MKEWKYRKRKDAKVQPPDMAEHWELSERMASLLWQRGFEAEDLRLYLSPLLRYLEAPSRWPGVTKAAELIAQHALAGKALAVWGDYDVDGITATALVVQVLRHFDLAVQWHLPDRQEEGYGLNLKHVRQMAMEGSSLLLTVDCGISDYEAVQSARDLGLTVIITDHHLPPDALPPAHAICNPRLGDCPFEELAGVGVAFFLMIEVNNLLAAATEKKRLDMRHTLDLVALGTLADMVPLQGQNRILTKNGLLVLAEARRPGVSELKAVSGYQPLAALGAGQVVFNLAPRINAAGRMANAATALHMLCCEDHHKAHELARTLDDYNARRRKEEDRIVQEALIQAEAELDNPALVLMGEHWNQGIVGIVASRMVEAYHKPCLVLCRDGQSLKGSGRSISAFNLHDGLAACSDMLLNYGGHAMAAGMRLNPERFPEFRQRFLGIVQDNIGSAPIPATLLLDGELSFALASDFTFLKELELMQPFGVGNPEPIFSSPPLLVRRRRLFGPQHAHVNLELLDESCGVTLHAKAWKQAAALPSDLEGKHIRIAYSPGIDNYNGISNVEVKIRDMVILD